MLYETGTGWRYLVTTRHNPYQISISSRHGVLMVIESFTVVKVTYTLQRRIICPGGLRCLSIDVVRLTL